MSETDKYAILTAVHETFGQIDIRVSREITIKEIIHNLFEALDLDQQSIKGAYHAKTGISQVLLNPTDTLEYRNICDGEILRIL